LVNRFSLEKLFSPQELEDLIRTFGFKRMSLPEIEGALQKAFTDYILISLSEFSSDSEEARRLYMESQFHLQKASKLLEGLPHPAGKMAYRISAMVDTLNKLIEGRGDFSAERATRFVEKNLVRQLRAIWLSNTSTPFHSGGDGSGRNPRDFLMRCFVAAGEKYPQLTWFSSVDTAIADQLIRSIKR
jgi:hypothetical protein